MYGLLIAIIIAGWSILFGAGTVAAGVDTAAGFLWVWYLAWSVILAGIMGLFTLGLVGGAATAGGIAAKSPLGVLVGLTAGAAVTFRMWLLFLARRVSLTCGAYLLATAGSPTIHISQFSIAKLVVGGLMVLLALSMFRTKRDG